MRTVTSYRSRAGSTLRTLVLLALSILVLTWVLRLAIEHLMNVPLDAKYWLRDYLGNLVFAGIGWLLIRRFWPTVLFAGFTLTGFHLINAGKLLVLGVPGSPDDFINIANLYHLAEGLQRVVVIAIAATPFLLLGAFTRWRSPVTWATIALLAVSVTFVARDPDPVRQSLDRRFGHSVWNQPENFRHRGLALHLVQESIRTAAKVGKAPSAEAVDTALAELPHAALELGGIARRNVHLIVLESFFDPMSLGPDWVPEDPFPAEFRALWAEAGNSVAMSPVFGGYTANAEFETLCGYPVTENAVFFEGWMRRPVPCLPRVLGEAGYRTVASHPNVPGFWNRTYAYQLAGFGEYYSKADFDTTDAIGSFMLDHAFYEQQYERLGPLQPEDGQPIFNYLLTYHGHLPFPKSDAYPDKVATAQEAPLLHGYINQLWYKSRDLMARLELLRAEDPEALIVIFGDHLPYLDPNYGVYADVLDLPADRKDFTAEQFEFLVSTPLIVIDGNNGPVDVGKVPLYRLPSLILERLGATSEGMFAWTDNPRGRLYRPVYGMHFETPADDDAAEGFSPIVCAPEAPEAGCETGMAWLARTRILIGDIFSGGQFALERLVRLGNS